MEKSIFILTLICNAVFSVETAQQKNLIQISEYLKFKYLHNKGDITVQQLKGMVAKIRALEIKRQQESEKLQRKQQDLIKMQQEMHRIAMEQREDDLKRQRIIKVYLEPRAGATSFMKDFIPNRIF
jgi:hypothetical protein